MMRVLLQRVSAGRVRVADEVVGEVGRGYVALVGLTHEDDRAIVEKMAAKIAHLRLFEDAEGKMNLSLLEVGGGVLVVSQFTLYGDARKGRRPSFSAAARPESAAPLVAYLGERLKAEGVAQVAYGRFGATMAVDIFNDGPVTLWLDSAEL
jgi:D-tyrosyl-tRNA(Tyr) deacylase